MGTHARNDRLDRIQDRPDVAVGERRGNEADNLTVGPITVPVDELNGILAHILLPRKVIEKSIQITLQARGVGNADLNMGWTGARQHKRKGALIRRPL